MVNEAVLSSRKGTQASLHEVLACEVEEKGKMPPQSSTDADIQEVLHYRRAMWFAEEKLEELPLSQRLVKEAHRILIDGVRGRNKAPGEYRLRQTARCFTRWRLDRMVCVFSTSHASAVS
jgi:Fic family protein